MAVRSTPVRRKEAKASGEPGWQWRKLLMFPVVGFAVWRLIAMESAPDTMVNQIMVQGWFWLLFAYFCVFTGFATAQDIAAILATRSGLPYATAQAEAEEPVPNAPAVPPVETQEQE